MGMFMGMFMGMQLFSHTFLALAAIRETLLFIPMKWIFAWFFFMGCGSQLASGQGLSAAENRSMMIASQRYGDLQKEGTPHYKAFQNLLNQSIKAKSVVFKDPNWPLIIAEQSRKSLPALQQGSRKVGRTAVEKYEDAIAEMLKSKDPDERRYGELEQAAHQAELSGDTVRAAELRAQLANLRALGRIEALLNEMSHDIWQLKRELGMP